MIRKLEIHTGGIGAGLTDQSLKSYLASKVAYTVKVRNRIMEEVFTRIIGNTPVDSGRLVMSWNFSINSPDFDSKSALGLGYASKRSHRHLPFGMRGLATDGPSGGDVAVSIRRSKQQEVASQIRRLKETQVNRSFFLANGQPYARKIEYLSHSMQAPNGMVRVVTEDFDAIVADVLYEMGAL